MAAPPLALSNNWPLEKLLPQRLLSLYFALLPLCIWAGLPFRQAGPKGLWLNGSSSLTPPRKPGDTPSCTFSDCFYKKPKLTALFCEAFPSWLREGEASMKRINFPTAINSSSPQRPEYSTMQRIKRHTIKIALTGKCHCSGRWTPRSLRHPQPWQMPVLEGDLMNGKPVLPEHSLKAVWNTFLIVLTLPYHSAFGTSLPGGPAAAGLGGVKEREPLLQGNRQQPSGTWSHFPVNYL